MPVFGGYLRILFIYLYVSYQFHGIPQYRNNGKGIAISKDNKQFMG